MKIRFEECPYNCNVNAQLFDKNLKKFISCPYCKEKRKDVANTLELETESGTESLHSIFGFKDEFLSPHYNFDSLISEAERALLLKESIPIVSDAIDELRSQLASGTLPRRSYCFGLGLKGYLDRLAFPLLVSAYKAGNSSGKFVSSRQYYSLYMQDKNVQEYLDYDILFVLIASGSSYRELSCIKGLMESRAVVGLPTILVTNTSIDDCLLLLGSVKEPSLYLASPYFLERVKTANSHSYASDNLRGISMADLENI